MSTPTGTAPGPAWSPAATEPSDSASTHDAPPCRRPNGWRFPSTGIVATRRPGPMSMNVMPTALFSSPEVSLIRRSASSRTAGSSRSMAYVKGLSRGVELSGVETKVHPVTDAAPGSRLLLLDGHSLAYRAFFALPVENFSTSTGQPTNDVYGFTSMLINILRDEKPTHVAVAFDV